MYAGEDYRFMHRLGKQVSKSPCWKAQWEVHLGVVSDDRRDVMSCGTVRSLAEVRLSCEALAHR